TGNRDPAELAKITTIAYGKVLAASLTAELAAKGIDIGKLQPKDIGSLISEESSAQLRNKVLADPALIGTTIPFTALATGRIDGYFKGRVTMASAALDKNTSPEKLALADKMKASGILAMRFNPGF